MSSTFTSSAASLTTDAASPDVTTTDAEESSTMFLISVGVSRASIGTSTAPSMSAPQYVAHHLGLFGEMIATREPSVTPASASAHAAARAIPWNSRYVIACQLSCKMMLNAVWSEFASADSRSAAWMELTA